jgi:AcrR family transcriptional regulator
MNMMNPLPPNVGTEIAKAVPGTRAQQKHVRILETSMRYFADLGYEATRVADIAQELGIAKGSIFQHFGSKDGLFLEAYKASLQSFPAFLDAPIETIQKGFFAILQYRLEQSEQFKREHATAYRIVLLGNYGSDLKLKKQINRFLIAEDPLGTVAFVKMGVERGEIRSDVDQDLVVSIVDWTFERFQDALLMEEFDPGLFRRAGEPKNTAKEQRITEFITVLRSAIGSGKAA